MKQTLCIQNPANVRVKASSVVLSSGDDHMTIPLEDLWVIILETHRASISSAALSAIVDHGIGVIICGKNHMPDGLLLPIGAHSRHAEIVERQLAMPKPLKKQLWKRIVEAKIRNQARVLQLEGMDFECVASLASEVKSDDSTNREAVAASLYFSRIIDQGTRRNGPYSEPLDYGYSVLRAGVGRTAVAGGWLVSRGIHHNSKLNAFNLVDDLIEPFRPVVDLLIIEEGIKEPMSNMDRTVLARVLECCVMIDGEKRSLQTAITLMLESLKDAVNRNDPTLLKVPCIERYEKVSVE